MVGHNTWVEERQNFLLLTAPQKRRLLGRVTQGIAPGDRVTAGWVCMHYLMHRWSVTMSVSWAPCVLAIWSNVMGSGSIRTVSSCLVPTVRLFRAGA